MGEGKLTLERPSSFDDIAIGTSICVSGVCLSVVSFNDDSMEFDVVPETLERSKLGFLKTGGAVNLERSLRADGRFEGHVVQGHCEGVGTVQSQTSRFQIPDSKSSHENLVVELPEELVPFVIPKGSIALDGVSLTVASIEGNRCVVALIPHTLENTTFGAFQKGDPINVETDVMIRALYKKCVHA